MVRSRRTGRTVVFGNRPDSAHPKPEVLADPRRTAENELSDRLGVGLAPCNGAGGRRTRIAMSLVLRTIAQ